MNKANAQIVFVVDDDEDVRDSMRVLLESFGFAVRDFANAADLLRSLPDGKAGCLVLDQNMPGMTGVELLEELRARKVDTPAIIVTAHHQNLSPRVAHLDVLAVLPKPVASQELLQWIQQAVAQNKSQ